LAFRKTPISGALLGEIGANQLNTSEALKRLLENLLALAAAAPLVIAGLRNQSRPDRLRLLGSSKNFTASSWLQRALWACYLGGLPLDVALSGLV
jgi:hypothetical protein